MSSAYEVFGDREVRFEEPKPLDFEAIDAGLESGELTMEEVYGPGGEDDPMPHMDNYFTGW